MKTGMVLEGGAVRTIYSTGVCDALLTRSLMTDYVIGVSAGIAYGVSYVSRQPRRNLDIMVNYINDKRYMGMGNLLRRDQPGLLRSGVRLFHHSQPARPL